MGTGPTPHYLGITPGATNRAVRAKYRRRDGALLAKNSTQGCATEPMRARVCGDLQVSIFGVALHLGARAAVECITGRGDSIYGKDSPNSTRPLKPRE